MNPVARALIYGGIGLVLLGVFWQFGGRFLHLGRMPGDIVVERPGFKFYFPLATSILISVLISLVLALFRFFNRS